MARSRSRSFARLLIVYLSHLGSRQILVEIRVQFTSNPRRLGGPTLLRPYSDCSRLTSSLGSTVTTRILCRNDASDAKRAIESAPAQSAQIDPPITLHFSAWIQWGGFDSLASELFLAKVRLDVIIFCFFLEGTHQNSLLPRRIQALAWRPRWSARTSSSVRTQNSTPSPLVSRAGDGGHSLRLEHMSARCARKAFACMAGARLTRTTLLARRGLVKSHSTRIARC